MLITNQDHSAKNLSFKKVDVNTDSLRKFPEDVDKLTKELTKAKPELDKITKGEYNYIIKAKEDKKLGDILEVSVDHPLMKGPSNTVAVAFFHHILLYCNSGQIIKAAKKVRDNLNKKLEATEKLQKELEKAKPELDIITKDNNFNIDVKSDIKLGDVLEVSVEHPLMSPNDAICLSLNCKSKDIIKAAKTVRDNLNKKIKSEPQIQKKAENIDAKLAKLDELYKD